MTTMEPPVMSAARACYTPAFCPMPTAMPRMEGHLASGPNLATLQGDHLPEKVFVGGLAEKTTEQDLREIFQQHAPVKTVKIITDKSLTSKSGEPRRYAFVEFHSADDAKTVLNAFSPDSSTGDVPQLELHGRRLNIGSAFKKTPTFGRTFGPSIVPTMMADPYQQMFNAWTMYSQKSPNMMNAGQYYMPYAAYGQVAHNPYVFPPSPTMARPMYTNGGPPSPGLTAPVVSGQATAPAMHPNQLAYMQLANSMIQMSLNNQANGGHQPTGGALSSDLDSSFLNSSSNTSGSSRNTGSDRPGNDRMGSVYPYGPQPQTQLPSGHVEQRERNGRIISVPQPIRLPNGGGGGGTSPSPYMTVPSPSPYGPADHGYLTASGMRHQYVQQH